MSKRLRMMRLVAFMIAFAMAFGSCVMIDGFAKYVTNAALAEENEVTEEAPETVE